MSSVIVIPRHLVLLAALTVLISCGGGDSSPVAPPPPGPGPGPVAPVLTTVQVSASVAQLYPSAPGNTTTINVTAMDQDGAVLSTGTRSFTTDNAAVATVSGVGTVTGLSAGVARITVAVTIGSVTKSASTSVTVVAPPAAAQVFAPSLSYEPGIVHIAAGGVVTWTIQSIHHTVTFSSPTAPANTGELRDAAASRTFAARGSYNYTCDFHAGMTGVVHVH